MATASTFRLSKTIIKAGDSADKIAVTITPSLSTYSHKIVQNFGVYSNSITISAGTLSAQISVPANWSNAIPTATTGTMTVILQTYNGSSLIGSTSQYVTVQCADYTVTCWGSFSGNGLISNIAYVQGHCSLSCTAYCKYTTLYGATITSAKFLVGSESIALTPSAPRQVSGGYEISTNNGTSSLITNSGDINVAVVFTDSRGIEYRTDYLNEIYVAEYFTPRLQRVSAARYKTVGGELVRDDVEGTTIVVYPSATVSGALWQDGVRYNTLSCSVSKSGSTTKTVSGSLNGKNWFVSDLRAEENLYWTNCSVDTSHTFTVTLSDNITGAVTPITITVPSAEVCMDFHSSGLGVSFGEVATETKTLNIAGSWAFKYSGKTLLDFFYPVGTIHIRYDYQDPATLFGGTWVQIIGRFLWATDPDDRSIDIGDKGGASTHTLTVNEMPAHTHKLSVYNASGSTVSGSVTNAGTKAYSPTLETSSAGGGQAFSIMPPYIHVAVWRRTA